MFQFFSDGTRNRLVRLRVPDTPQKPNDTINFHGFEAVKAPMCGGPDAVVFFDDFNRSDVAVVRVDLGPATTAPDPAHGNINSAEVTGPDGPSRIKISGTPTTVIDASQLAAGTVTTYTADKSGGDDVLIGFNGDDTLVGSFGNDRLEGRGRNRHPRRRTQHQHPHLMTPPASGTTTATKHARTVPTRRSRRPDGPPRRSL